MFISLDELKQNYWYFGKEAFWSTHNHKLFSCVAQAYEEYNLAGSNYQLVSREQWGSPPGDRNEIALQLCFSVYQNLLQATENWLVSQDILVVNSVFQWKFGTLTKGFPCLRKNIFPQKKKYYFINLLTELPNPSSSVGARCCRASWEAPTIRWPRGHFITKMALCFIPLSRRELCRAFFTQLTNLVTGSGKE